MSTTARLANEMIDEIRKQEHDNMLLWNSVRTPEEKYVKKMTHGAKLNSIDLYYIVRLATKRWGTCGGKWGFREVKVTIVPDTPIKPYKNSTSPPVLVPSIMMQGVMEYPGSETGIMSVVDTPFYAGDDSTKKCLSMLVSKSLSFAGFASDVYLGFWDDMAYREQAVENTSPGWQTFYILEKKVDAMTADTKVGIASQLNTAERDSSIPGPLLDELRTKYRTKLVELESQKR
jgi:hypothetical protein